MQTHEGANELPNFTKTLMGFGYSIFGDTDLTKCDNPKMFTEIRKEMNRVSNSIASIAFMFGKSPALEKAYDYSRETKMSVGELLKHLNITAYPYEKTKDITTTDIEPEADATNEVVQYLSLIKPNEEISEPMIDIKIKNVKLLREISTVALQFVVDSYVLSIAEAEGFHKDPNKKIGKIYRDINFREIVSALQRTRQWLGVELGALRYIKLSPQSSPV